MYDNEYAQKWIQNHESGNDTYRNDYLVPFFRTMSSDISDENTVIDVGCGWGQLLEFLPQDTRYVGIDKTKEFLDYIRKQFPNRKKELLVGSLPTELHQDVNLKGDYVICSQVLHTVQNMVASVQTLFEKTKESGTVVIITFCDKSKLAMKNSFKSVDVNTDNHILGTVALPSEVVVPAEIYFHLENDLEHELQKYSTFEKSYLGPLFTAYICTKTS